MIFAGIMHQYSRQVKAKERYIDAWFDQTPASNIMLPPII